MLELEVRRSPVDLQLCLIEYKVAKVDPVVVPKKRLWPHGVFMRWHLVEPKFSAVLVSPLTQATFRVSSDVKRQRSSVVLIWG